MMKRLIVVLLAATLSAQVKQLGPAKASGPTKQTFSSSSPPAFVNATTCTTGAAACTTGFSPANGDRLLVFAVNDSTTSAVSCSDGEGTGNTYTRDSDISGTGVRGSWFHSASTVTGSGTYTITCTGTGANFFIGVIEYSGGVGGLAAVSAGTNPSMNNPSGATFTTTAFTTSDANVILVDGLADATGNNVTSFTQTDGSFTSRGTACTNGGVCFVGNIGSRVVSATASYSDGMTLGSSTLNGCAGGLAAYK